MPGKSLIQQAAAQKAAAQTPATNALSTQGKQSVSAILNGILDGEGYRKRIDELLGKRAPQFVSSIVTMASNDNMLRKVVATAPTSIITSALKAAALDLPIDPALGMAYVMPFKNAVKNPDGTTAYRDEATLVIGYRALIQMAQRTGMYKYLNADFVYEGEIIVDDRVSGMVSIEGEKKSDKIIAYFCYFQLLNGFEKCLCWTREKVEAHEKKHRKGQYMSKAWRDDFDAMALKTVIRALLSKWGPLSVDYQSAPSAMVKATEDLQNALSQDDDNLPIEGEGVVFEDVPQSETIDPDTGEIKPNDQ